jgi:hypothetical protein
MKKLNLYAGEKLQGEYIPKTFNLILMFQVNCPGCFTHAFPLFNKLYKRFNNELGFIALSTAFEDFDLNTKENTELLINSNEFVGETKKAFIQQNINKLPYELLFPIAMDSLLQSNQKTEVIEAICSLNPNYPIWSEFDQKLLQKKVSEYLDNQQKVSLTFTTNQFKGTPTIGLFNDQNELLHSWFGHHHFEGIVDTIDSFSIK